MKKFFILLLFVPFLSALMNFCVYTEKDGEPQPMSAAENLRNRFYLGTFTFPNLKLHHSDYYFGKYDSLSYNLLIGYIGHVNNEEGCNVYGGFYDDASKYSARQTEMTGAFESRYSSKGGFSVFLEREKILRPAYGQSSTYQAENTNPAATRPGYGFTVTGGSVYTENQGNETVSGLLCEKGGNEKYMVSSLYENLEQVNVLDESNDPNYVNMYYNLGDRKNNDKKGYYWYVKPRMRIDSAFAVSNLNTPAVSVITVGYSGRTIDSTVITCRNFGKIVNGVFRYNGGYTEVFYKDENGANNVPFFIKVPAERLTEGVSFQNIARENLPRLFKGGLPRLLARENRRTARLREG